MLLQQYAAKVAVSSGYTGISNMQARQAMLYEYDKPRSGVQARQATLYDKPRSGVQFFFSKYVM